MKVHGHRGARARCPENTVQGFEYAIGIGVDAIELDVGLTRDGALVVIHDAHLPDGRLIRDLTREEVQDGTDVPTLDEVFTLSARGAFHFDVEMKSYSAQPSPAEYASLVLAVIRRHNLEARVAVLSFDFRVLHAMQRVAPQIRLAALWEGEPRDFAATAREAGAVIVSPEYRLVTPRQVTAAHNAGLSVVPWTANTTEAWAALIDAGVDGIITDDPAALFAYLDP